MKFMIEYRLLKSGLTGEQVLANSQALTKVFGRWKVEEGLKVHAFVAALTGSRGYALVEADDFRIVKAFITKFVFWIDAEITPVQDIGESVAMGMDALAWAQTALKT